MNEMTGFKEIEIGGKKRPVKYGWNALALLEEFTGINTLNPFEVARALTTAKFQTAVIEVGLREGCRVTKKEVDFTKEDIGEWLDSEGINKTKPFTALFSNAISDAAMKGMTEEEKKSLSKLSGGLTSGGLPSENSASSPPSSGT